MTSNDRKCLGCKKIFTSKNQIQNYYYGVNIGISKILKCEHCGLSQVNYIPAKKELDTFYQQVEVEDILFGLTPEEIKKWKQPKTEDSVIKFIIKKLKIDKGQKINFLDIGAGNGIILVHANHYTNWKTLGLEPNIQKSKILKKLGINFLHTSLDNYKHSGEKFDIINMSQVLEHLTNPMDALKKINNLLNPSGAVWIDLPNCIDLYFKSILSDHSPHLTFWESSSLVKIFEKLDYKVISVGSFGTKIKSKIDFKDFIVRESKYYFGWTLKKLGFLSSSVSSVSKENNYSRGRIIDKDQVGIFTQFNIQENNFQYHKLYLLAIKRA